VGEKLVNALGGVVGTLAGGTVAFLTGLLDPSWLVANIGLWFPSLTGFFRFLGPELAPGVPWSSLLPGLVAVAIAVRIYRWRKRTEGG
jgi:hypothetical protein